MVKKLQYKFIAIATGSVFIMLLLVLGMINIISSVRNNRESNLLLNYIAENDGYIPSFRNEKFGGSGDLESVLTPETQFETRYFSARVKGGMVVDLNMEHIAALSEREAADYAIELSGRDQERGKEIVSGRSYDYLTVRQPLEDDLVVVLDTTKFYYSTVSLVRFSAYIGVVMIGIFFVMVSVLSRRVLKPIIDNIESQKQFITNASHELKTPLAIISANTEVIEMTAGDSEWTKSIRNQVERLTGLINRLIALARLQEWGNVEFTQLSATDIVREMADSFRPVASQQGKEYVTDIASDVTVPAEERSFRDLISILLDNAVKYCDDNGRVEVELTKKGRQMLFTVSNTYSAGENVDYSRFFERFYREDQSHNSEKKGYGIGLSMAGEITRALKGKLAVAYKNGMVSFTVSI